MNTLVALVSYEFFAQIAGKGASIFGLFYLEKGIFIINSSIHDTTLTSVVVTRASLSKEIKRETKKQIMVSPNAVSGQIQMTICSVSMLLRRVISTSY